MKAVESGESQSDSAAQAARFSTLKWEVEREERRIYKVQKLFLAKLEKQEAWETLRKIHPDFKKGTFNASWQALQKSKGRTPSLNEL